VPTFSSSTLHKKGHKKIIEHPKVSGAVETKEAKKETTVKNIFHLGRTCWALRWRLAFPTDIVVIVIVKVIFLIIIVIIVVVVLTPSIVIALHRLGTVFWRGIGTRRFLPPR
jgi:hypothetical protein